MSVLFHVLLKLIQHTSDMQGVPQVSRLGFDAGDQGSGIGAGMPLPHPVTSYANEIIADG